MEDLYTSPVPTKVMGSSLRHTKSEENLAGVEQCNSSGQTSMSSTNIKQSVTPTVTRPFPLKGVPHRSCDVTFNFPDDDPNDIWSQEDDEITQQVSI